MPGWPPRARISARSLPPWVANCWASSGHRREGGNRSPDNPSRHKTNSKSKRQNLSNREKAKTHQPMNNVNQLKDRASRSRSTHEGRILDRSMRQAQPELATLVRGSSRRIMTMRFPTREYQIDQSSFKLLRLPLALSLKNKNHPTATQRLTGHSISERFQSCCAGKTHRRGRRCHTDSRSTKHYEQRKFCGPAALGWV